jgi:dipeptidyl aminopeptidase/acylaminoacyl peptidase
MESGYSLYIPNKKLKKLIYGKSSCSLIRKAAQGNSYLYVEQTANTAPRVLFAPTLTKEPKVLFQSNPQYSNYDAGQAELIAYATEKEKDLKGILYYPVGYTPGKKYPMVVYIYEKLSGGFHQYMRPTWFDGDGFNAVNYTLDGYLVLMPDIKLEVGEPGESAVACVLAAVNAVSEKGILDRNRIGLIGHSFGGYEVPYILTQTSLFKAGVAGAGITDMISNYFFFHGATEHSNMWRYETQQLRMGKTPFEDYQAYIRNSPIAHADKITTPLLLWSGKEDNNVPPEQSMELYMALRRLNKRNLLLLYPEENHVIQKPDNQIDLNLRIKNWFDYYLKGSEMEKPY